MNITLTKVKTAGGEETPRFEARLAVDGVEVAIVTNGGTGGANRYHWLDEHRYPGLVAQIETLAKQVTGATFEPLDALVFQLLDEIALAKRLKRTMKTKHVFRLVGDKPGEYRTATQVGWTDIRKVLREKYGEKLACIVGDLPENERAKRIMREET